MSMEIDGREYEGELIYNDLRLPTDHTLAFTWGRWGGVYRLGHKGWWRLCLGWLAVTYVHDEFTALMKAYLDSID